MKVLYINHSRDGTGYGRAAIDYMLAMDSVGIEVVSRPLRLNNNKSEIPARIAELEGRNDKGCDVLLMHTLPPYFVYNGNFKKCIGMFAVENDRIPQEWVDNCDICCDEVWTFCEEAARAIRRSGVEVPIRVVPHAIDLEKFTRSYPKLEIRKQFPNDVLFYSIGEFQPRKGFGEIVRAFFTALDPEDAAQLILKVNIPGKSPEETLKIVGDFCNDVKRKLRLYPNVNDYKPVHIISHHLSDEYMMILHNTCDVYVNASRGEGWGLAITDAMGLGKTIITPAHTAMKDYINYSNAYVVHHTKSPCYGHMNTLPNLSTAREQWHEVDVEDLTRNIFAAYQHAVIDPEYNNNKFTSKNAMKTVFDNYGYEKVGNIIKGLLNG